MNNEVVTLLAVGALTAALLWCWTRRLVAWLRWKREHKAEAERREMLGAACREVSEYWRELSEPWYWLAVSGAGKVNSLEKEKIELQDKLKQATGNIRVTLPRNSCITQQIQSAIEGLDRIGERIGKLDIGEENREGLRYEIESLAEKLANILREFSGGGGTACPDDSEDDFGAARALEPGSGGTSATQAADPVQGLDADAVSPPPSNNGPPVRQRNRRKQTSRRRRSKDRGTER